MPVSFGGINTGLPPNLVDQLVEAERIPIKTLEAKKGKVEEKLKLVDDLDGKLRDVTKNLKALAGTRGFSDVKLISGDPNVVEGTVDPELAQNGNWGIEVDKLANKAAALSNGFQDKDQSEIGVGYFKFDTPEGTKDVYIHKGNNTLEGAAKTINAANVGMRASVIRDGSDSEYPWRLIVSADKVGGDNNVKYPIPYFLDGDQDFYFDKNIPAANGLVKIDGFDIEIPDNKIEDLVPGVTLTLKQAAPGKMINLTVKEDMQVVSGKIKTFVDSMNGVLGFLQTQSHLTKESDTTKTLGGDSVVRTVENQLRSLLQSQQYGLGSITSLNQLSIVFNRNGTLEFDEEKFNSVLAKNSNGVRAFLVGNGFDTGFMAATRRTISGLTDGIFGAVSNKKRTLQEEIRQSDERIANMERLVVTKEQNLRRKFATLEETMSRLKNQGAQLAAKLGGGGGQDFNLGGASGTPG